MEMEGLFIWLWPFLLFPGCAGCQPTFRLLIEVRSTDHLSYISYKPLLGTVV